MAGPDADIIVGQRAAAPPKIPIGTTVHNVELKEGKGGQMVRSAGAGRAADGARRRMGDCSGFLPARCAGSTSAATRRSGRSATLEHENV